MTGPADKLARQGSFQAYPVDEDMSNSSDIVRRMSSSALLDFLGTGLPAAPQYRNTTPSPNIPMPDVSPAQTPKWAAGRDQATRQSPLAGAGSSTLRPATEPDNHAGAASAEDDHFETPRGKLERLLAQRAATERPTRRREIPLSAGAACSPPVLRASAPSCAHD